MFRGRYQHTIDPKGRLSVPARFRDVLASYEGQLVVVPNEHCLEIHPLEEWQEIERKVSAQSQFSTDVRALGRLYISRARDVALDGVGRVLLPPEVRQESGLHREVTLVGPGRRMFEVWDRARFEEYERTGADQLPTLFARLSELGV